MIKTESIFTEEYLNNIKIATGTKATLLQPEGKMLIPVVKLYTSERTGKWIYSGIFGYFPFFLLIKYSLFCLGPREKMSVLENS